MLRARLPLCGLLLLAGCEGGPPPVSGPGEPLVVTATAYSSHPSETSGDPHVGAWGDRLEPGVKGIAVSRDLEALGLERGARVRIEGLPGEYRVLDRMARRWRKRIDIYMGLDRQAARRWGRRKVEIRWWPPPAPDA